MLPDLIPLALFVRAVDSRSLSKASFPDVKLELEEARSVEIVQALRKGMKYDLVALDSSAAMMRLLSRAAAKSGQLRLLVQVKRFEAVCKLVQANMGIGVLPEVATLDFAHELGLRLIRLTDDWADRCMYVCVRDFDRLSANGRKLVEQLVDAVSLRNTRSPARPDSDSCPPRRRYTLSRRSLTIPRAERVARPGARPSGGV